MKTGQWWTIHEIGWLQNKLDSFDEQSNCGPIIQTIGSDNILKRNKPNKHIKVIENKWQFTTRYVGAKQNKNE